MVHILNCLLGTWAAMFYDIPQTECAQFTSSKCFLTHTKTSLYLTASSVKD